MAGKKLILDETPRPRAAPPPPMLEGLPRPVVPRWPGVFLPSVSAALNMNGSLSGQGPSTEVPRHQRFWALPSEARNAVPVDDVLVRQCDTLLDAIHLCIHLSKFKNYVLCDKLGIDRGHWTRMMQGQAHFPPNKLNELMKLAGNLAPLQWLSASMGIPLGMDAKQQRRAQLMRELELLDAA